MQKVEINAAEFLAMISNHFDDLYLNEILKLAFHFKEALRERNLPFTVIFDDVTKIGNGYHSTDIEGQIELLKNNNYIKLFDNSSEEHFVLLLKDKMEKYLSIFKDSFSLSGIEDSSIIINQLEQVADEVSKMKEV